MEVTLYRGLRIVAYVLSNIEENIGDSECKAEKVGLLLHMNNRKPDLSQLSSLSATHLYISTLDAIIQDSAAPTLSQNGIAIFRQNP